METEYSSYRLGLTEKRARWLVTWPVTSPLRRWRGLGQAGICRDLPGLGEAIPGAAICLVVSHPRSSGSHDDTHHAEGPL